MNNTDLVITNSADAPLSSVRSLLVSGLGAGEWNGPGIVSSYAATHPGTSLGSATAGELSLSQFDGQSVSPDAILIKYTWLGDTNLDGVVTVADLHNISATGTDWATGDFNYDGIVNADDYALFSLGLAEQTGTLSPAPEPRRDGLWDRFCCQL